MEAMTPEEYKEGMREIESEYKSKRISFQYKCAMSRAKFKVGDIIHDSSNIIHIQKITAYMPFGGGEPEPVYNGPILTKKMVARKDGEWGAIYGNIQAELIS